MAGLFSIHWLAIYGEQIAKQSGRLGGGHVGVARVNAIATITLLHQRQNGSDNSLYVLFLPAEITQFFLEFKEIRKRRLALKAARQTVHPRRVDRQF